MSGLKPNLIKSGLEVLYRTGAYRLFESQWGGAGVIFTLHHIRPQAAGLSEGFHPNGILEITPEFLEDVLRFTAANGFEFVSLGEAVDRICAGDDASRFACFTIDDGYRDNLECALPVFRTFDCPFTVFVTSGIIDGDVELWWLALEEVISGHDSVAVALSGEHREFATADDQQKQDAYAEIYWHLRSVPEDEQRRTISALCADYGLDLKALCRREAMTWDEVRRLAGDPLVTIGAHTVNHYALAKLDRDTAISEMEEGRQRLADELGIWPDLFSYPYGDPGSAGQREFDIAREVGFRAAVTTRKGMVFGEHRDHLHALPRISLNGDYQSLKYVDLFLSGAPFALWNRFRRVNAA